MIPVLPGRHCLLLLYCCALVTAALLLAIQLDLSPWLRGPAPYPPEWQWSLRDSPSTRGLAAVVGCTAGLVALLFLSALPAATRRPLAAGAAIVLLTIGLSLGFQLSLLAMEDGDSATDTLITRTTSASFTSYFTVAVGPECRDIGSFLENHASLLHRLPVHARTHPPGAVLFYRGFLALFEARPELTDRVVDWSGRTDVDPDDEPALATALAGAFSLLLVANLSCAAVALLAAVLGLPHLASARVAVLWALVPGFSLMVPEFDQLLALPVVLSAALLGCSLQGARRRRSRCGLGFVAGVVGGSGPLISYGSALFVVLAGLVVLAASLDRAVRRPIDTSLALACAVAGACLVFAIPALFGHDPIASVLEGLRLHRAEFTAPRSYFTWLIFNVWDFAIFVGFPIALVFAYRVARSARSLRSGWTLPSGIDSRLACAVAAGGILLLDLSGTVRAEAGRIWIPLMPLILVTSMLPANRDATEPDAAAELAGPSVIGAVALAILLAACSLVLRLSWHLP